jgi:hypothetical protein
VESGFQLVERRIRAVDSTILADAVAAQDTVTQVVAAIRRVERYPSANTIRSKGPDMPSLVFRVTKPASSSSSASS